MSHDNHAGDNRDMWVTIHCRLNVVDGVQNLIYDYLDFYPRDARCYCSGKIFACWGPASSLEDWLGQGANVCPGCKQPLPLRDGK
jgi:hypothetical protein